MLPVSTKPSYRSFHGRYNKENTNSSLIEWPNGSRAAFCLRVDVESENCLIKGVPILLDLFNEYDIKVTFFLPMGPDRLGANFKVRSLPRYLHLDPLMKFGLKNLLHGLVLPPPNMGKRYSSEMRAIANYGHEVGLHGYDHTRWAQSLRYVPDEEVQKLFIKGFEEYTKVFGKRPKAFASPEFVWTPATLEMLDQHQFLYGSDTKGSLPFWPKIRGRAFKTLQVPVTLPNLEELSHRGISDRKALMLLCKVLEKKIRMGGLATLLIHPSYEGIWKKDLLLSLLDFITKKRDELWIVPMEEVAKWWISKCTHSFSRSADANLLIK